MPHFNTFNNFSNSKIKFIKSLRLKKYRLQENSFVLEGEKNVIQLLASTYQITMLAGTPQFFNSYAPLLTNRNIELFQVDETTLSSLGTFQKNNAALAVATIPPHKPFEINNQEYTLALDGINDPGNLGTIIRVADWYKIASVVCSINTVELYNPKVLHASMGSFLRVNIHYTDLQACLAQAKLPIIGTFTDGPSIHDPKTIWPTRGIIVIGNEAKGISSALMPYIQQRISIPRYGQAESLNAALATAILCDNFRRVNRPLV